jgi:hypothetical protein
MTHLLPLGRLRLLRLPLEINDYHRAVVRPRQSTLAVIRRNVLLTLAAPIRMRPLCARGKHFLDAALFTKATNWQSAARFLMALQCDLAPYPPCGRNRVQSGRQCSNQDIIEFDPPLERDPSLTNAAAISSRMVSTTFFTSLKNRCGFVTACSAPWAIARI